MSNGDTPKGTLVESLKAILQSQVGGWVIACCVTVAVGWWVVKDRELVYKDLHGLREKAMPLIIESNHILKEIQEDLRRKRNHEDVDITRDLPTGGPS